MLVVARVVFFWRNVLWEETSRACRCSSMFFEDTRIAHECSCHCLNMFTLLAPRQASQRLYTPPPVPPMATRSTPNSKRDRVSCSIAVTVVCSRPPPRAYIPLLL